jgi:hypothetical protein
LQVETRTAATLTVVGCFLPSHTMQGSQKLKPMTKDITVSHNSTTCCDSDRCLCVEIDDLSHFQFGRQER